MPGKKTTASSIDKNFLEVKGAKEHNLKNIDIKIPKNKFVVFTGVSGSGKSSLAFDTIYAEGQRRYIESLSSYARQFLGQMEKPHYESLKGLSPTIAIEQKSASKNPRSTVGTITEVYDYLRVMYARLGTQHCMQCNKPVSGGDIQSIVKQTMGFGSGAKLMILAPVVQSRKGEHRDIILQVQAQGFNRLRVNGVITTVEELGPLAKHKKHTIEAVIDRIVIKQDKNTLTRLTDSLETAAKLADGFLIVNKDGKDHPMSLSRSCCGIAYPELDPPLFSFNSPQGMCSDCNGIGHRLAMDPQKILTDPKLSIAEGAIKPWANFFLEERKGKKKKQSWGRSRISAMEKSWGLDIHKPWNKLSKTLRDRIMHGSDNPNHQYTMRWNGEKGQGKWQVQDEGLVNRLWKRYQQTSSERMKEVYQDYLSSQACQSCEGQRLRREMLFVKVDKLAIHELSQLNIERAFEFVQSIKLPKWQQIIGEDIIREISSRLFFLNNVGLGYLTLNRAGPSLSGGEAQRIRLASQIGSELTGVLYVLDEPSIGLHQRDNRKLLDTLNHLRDLGNSLIVVEHDLETIESADWVIDFGPRAGKQGGEVISAGTPKQISRDRNSLTGQYMVGKKEVGFAPKRPVAAKHPDWLILEGVQAQNLKNIQVKIPCQRLVAITGVSGAGKSTLVNRVLYPSLANHLMGGEEDVLSVKKVKGMENFDKVIKIDQQPIGRTPRSNPATYTKLYDLIRDLFATLPESKVRGYQKGRFSFNVKGGRCENCQGDGSIKVEMHFLSDVYVECQTCHGKRFNESTLEVKYKGLSISDVLSLSVAEASDIFKNQPKMKKIIDTLLAVGLDYVSLGQPSTTLSGGEAQRIKLARELARRDTGKTFYILDEPTTGLHFEDCRNLLIVLDGLVQSGNTVLLIEHNLDLIRSSDWVIDLGPEGGDGGGEVIATGTPQEVAKIKKSYTGQFLKEYFEQA